MGCATPPTAPGKTHSNKRTHTHSYLLSLTHPLTHTHSVPTHTHTPSPTHAGDMVEANVQFCPRDWRAYDTKLPLFLSGETEPYMVLEVR